MRLAKYLLVALALWMPLSSFAAAAAAYPPAQTWTQEDGAPAPDREDNGDTDEAANGEGSLEDAAELHIHTLRLPDVPSVVPSIAADASDAASLARARPLPRPPKTAALL